MLRRSLHVTALGLLLLPSSCFRSADASRPLASVTLPRAVLDSMNAVFAESNLNWDQLQDLNTMERMLGTIRPTQREYLGCLQGEVAPAIVTVDGYVPARNMRRLQLAVTGSCDSIAGVIGSWHTHPFHADSANQPLKSRELSPQDLATFGASSDRVVIVVWDRDSMDAAVKAPDGRVIHPARLEIR